jgi:NAD(P)-dependent dehydrogenase (short-subunit alcohol dehydrogenase family)
MCNRLINRIALVTGGGSGIGEGICIRFAEEGAHIAVADIREEIANEVTKKIRTLGRDSIALKIDVSQRLEVEKTVEKIINYFGRIDILVNSAGISNIIPFIETTDEIWDNTISINLRGTFLCCQVVIQQMLKQGKGKIINLSSQSGKRGTSWSAAYCASKAGIIGLTQSIATEFAPNRININAICPGIVFTPMWDKQLEDYGRKKNLLKEEVKDYLLSKIPLGYFAEPQEVANLAVFMASDESDYMTGQAINFTGGQEMR